MARKTPPSPDLYFIGGFALEPVKTLSELFGEGASLTEGVAGRTAMESTEFENTQTRGELVSRRNED